MNTLQRLRGLVEDAILWVFFIVVTIGMTVILALNLRGGLDLAVTENQPAPNDVFAPRSLTYISEIETAQEREEARRSVAEVFSSLDLAIGRAQLSQARATLSFIDVVRADSNATTEQKIEYLRAIEGLTIDDTLATEILNLSQSDFEEVRTDILRIIEDLMREEIRPNQLSDYQRTARRLASLDLTPPQTIVVTGLAHQFIVPTVFPDPEATELARQEAAAAVEPVTRSVALDQRVLRAGEIVTALDIELLEELGLLRRETNWLDVASLFMASLLSVTLITLYWRQFEAPRYPGGRNLAVVGGLLLLFTAAARVMATSEVLSFWYPIVALSMLLTVVYNVQFAILVVGIMSTIAGLIAPLSFQLAVYLASGGFLAALTLRDVQRVTTIFRAGLAGAVGHIFAILLFALPQPVDPPALLQQIGFGLGNGLLSAALTMAGFYVLGGGFGVITILHLQDLSRLDHPLLRDLLRRAPGTYHHSIMVANLAEQAAERIGANSALVRVGAFYHDVGKMVRPPFFSENQEGINPHDSLDPYTSARIIISHVRDGLEFARKYRLPYRVRDFIAEHHGERLVKGFLHKAQEAAAEEGGTVDENLFRYPGPRPRSRESAIVMLADAIDATSTALRPDTESAIVKLVNSIIEEDLLDKQLQYSGLTLGDIEQLRNSFIETLKGRFHVRVTYPGNENLITDVPPAIAQLGPGAEQEAVIPAERQLHRRLEPTR